MKRGKIFPEGRNPFIPNLRNLPININNIKTSYWQARNWWSALICAMIDIRCEWIFLILCSVRTEEASIVCVETYKYFLPPIDIIWGLSYCQQVALPRDLGLFCSVLICCGKMWNIQSVLSPWAWARTL